MVALSHSKPLNHISFSDYNIKVGVLHSYFDCRVLEMMRRDAQEDPEDNPDALQARLLLDQVVQTTIKFLYEPNLTIQSKNIFVWTIKCKMP